MSLCGAWLSLLARHISPSTNRCHHLGNFRMASGNHSSRTAIQHPVQFPCNCRNSAPSWTQCCVQLLSLLKLQLTDDEYLMVWRLLSIGTMWSVPAHDNRLPFWDSRPCASTRLSNEAIAFHRHARLEPPGGGMQCQDYNIRWQFAQSHSLSLAETADPVQITSERPPYIHPTFWSALSLCACHRKYGSDTALNSVQYYFGENLKIIWHIPSFCLSINKRVTCFVIQW